MVELYNSSQLKEACDSAIELILDDMGYQQIYSPEFIRLAFSLLNVAVCAALFFAERKYSFFDLYDEMVAAVIVSLVLTVVCYLWKFMYERNADYIGLSPSDQFVYITSKCKDYENLEISVADVMDNVEQKTVKLASLFDYNGKIIRTALSDILQSMLKDDFKLKSQ